MAIDCATEAEGIAVVGATGGPAAAESAAVEESVTVGD